MEAKIDGTSYRIEFSYRTKGNAKGRLAKHLNIQGISICVIVIGSGPPRSDAEVRDEQGGIFRADWAKPVHEHESDIVAIGCAVCAPDDRFNRRQGRILAFKRATMNPLLPPLVKEALLFWFSQHFQAKLQRMPPKLRLSEGAKYALKNSKQATELRRLRRARRNGEL